MASDYEGWKPAGKLGRGMHSRVGGLDFETIPWKPVKMARKGREVGKLLRDEYYTCAFCKGTGERPKGSKCPACRGGGEVRLNPPSVGCAFCNGTGEKEPRSQVTCLVCKGKGKVSVVEPVKICYTCNGKGRVLGSALYCMTCKGKGVVAARGKVDETTGETRPFMSRPSGTARDIADVIYQQGGQAHYQHIARQIRISSPAYVESICEQMTEKGYLEKLSRGVYALSPNCEGLMQEQEEKQRGALSADEAKILNTIVMAEDDEELKSMDIAKKTGLKLADVNKICNKKLGEQDFINISLSGKIDLTEKGLRAIEYFFGQEELEQNQATDLEYELPEEEEGVKHKDEQWENIENLKEYKI